MLALREIILSVDESLTPEWKYKTPFFYYRGKMFCYLWIHKKYKLPYIGIVKGHRIEHPSLISEERRQIKIMLINPDKDIPVKKIKLILNKALDLYD